MYTSFIGKKFLEAWNAREGRDLTARRFFDEVMFPVFFNEEKHLLQVNNSKFVNPSIKGTNLEKLELLHGEIEKAVATNKPNGAFYVGYGVSEPKEGTSGQITSTQILFDEEECYASWIGAAFGMGLDGGNCILVNDTDFLLTIHDGWKFYRKYLKETPNFKGRQLEAWNAQWFASYLINGYDQFFYPKEGKAKADENGEKGNDNDKMLSTVRWSEMIMALCLKKPSQTMTIYAYKLGKTNTTLGFLNLKLQEVHTMFEVRDRYFIDQKDSILTDKQIQELEPLFGFKRACEQGAIGLRSLEPAKLRDYLPQRGDKKTKDFKITDDKSNQQFHLFKLWIYAMLNKTELLELAGEVAASLHAFEGKAERGKATHGQRSDEARNANTLRIFVDKLGEILADYPAAALTFHHTVEQVMKMPSDLFPLFVTLVRFEYNYQKHQPKGTLIAN